MRSQYPVGVLAKASAAAKTRSCDYDLGDWAQCPQAVTMTLVSISERMLPGHRNLCDDHGIKVWEGLSPDWTRVNLYHAGHPIIQD